MPWSFKATMAMFVVFAAGAVLIGFACFESGWQALTGGLLFSIICAVTQPTWRKTVFVLGRPRVIALGRSRCVCQDGVRGQLYLAGFRDASRVRRLRRIVSQSTSRGCCEGAAAVKANLRFRISIKLRM